MTLREKTIYRSSNGDRWTLMRETATGRQFVRHKANPLSGGRITDTGVDEFLSVAGPGPEFAALRRMLSFPEDGEQAPSGDHAQVQPMPSPVDCKTRSVQRRQSLRS
jgi:hypothetical protein